MFVLMLAFVKRHNPDKLNAIHKKVSIKYMNDKRFQRVFVSYLNQHIFAMLLESSLRFMKIFYKNLYYLTEVLLILHHPITSLIGGT